MICQGCGKTVVTPMDEVVVPELCDACREAAGPPEKRKHWTTELAEQSGWVG